MPHPEHETGAPRAPGDHLDEGTIHAWLDGALSSDEQAAAAAHAALCPACAAAVAEARGVIAGASRILASLDGGLGAVSAAPAATPAAGAAPAGAATIRRRSAPRRWWSTAPARAAAVLLVAVGSGVVLTTADSRTFGEQAADSIVALDSTSASPAAAQPLASQQNAPMPTTVAIGRATGAAVAAGSGAARAADRPEKAAAQELAFARSADSSRPVAAAPPSAPPANTMIAAAPLASTAAADRARSMGVAGGVARGAPGAARQELRGIVREAGSQRPVEGVTVTIEAAGARAVTDSAGRFVLPAVPTGSHVALARRIGYQADTVAVAVAPGRAAEVRVELQPSATALTAQRMTGAAAAPSARAFSPGGRAPNARDVAGCYRLSVTPAGAGPLPVFVRLDTTGTAGGTLGARLMDAAGASGRWTDAGWSLTRTGALEMPRAVTLSWRTSLGRAQLDLARDGAALTGVARLPGDSDAGLGVARLVRAACPPDAP